ncbi:uncharacterized protein LOC113500349 [Trichoplusia ni]|uniref:Uncharacterized protein LOC113500349 n=1 Tax=Trichoplusia ni TaxID=7111 RepID=A0A7E5W8E4_TRINI|nr:uncharacterized protein LOC113500349 [Trichoplusia ni]
MNRCLNFILYTGQTFAVGRGVNKMFLLLVIYLQLVVLHTSVSQEYRCFDDSYYFQDEIKLIEVRKGNLINIYNELNAEFIRKCHYYYNISSLVLNDNTISTTRALTYKYVINLFTQSIHEYGEPPNYGYDKIMYAGDINRNESFWPELIDVHNSSDPKCVINNITQKHDCYGNIKLVSKGVAEVNSNDLFNFVSSIEFVNNEVRSRESCYTIFESPTQLNKVLLCLDEGPDRSIVIEITPLNLVISMNCTRIFKSDNENFLAVLAPKPFKIDTDYNLVPTIFYETPYLSVNDDTTFVNAIPLVPWQLLKYVYLEFLRSMGWRRAVIFSDDSFYSIEFEAELTQLFNEEKIVYTVLRCYGAGCNVPEVRSSLISVEATIVIANVEQENAKYLLRTVTNIPYVSDIIWLVRDLPMYILQSFHRSNVFSLSLASTRHKQLRCMYNDLILDGINRVCQAHRHLSNPGTELRKTFYRKFAEQIRKEKPETEEIVGYVRQAFSPEDVLVVLINKDGVKSVLKFSNPFKGQISDGVNCVMRSYDYFRPCQDVLIIVFMFVIILFATTLLLITCYFHKTSPIHGFKYRHF